MITYKATGIVLGNYWGGGKGSYPTHEINANSLRELNEKIEEQLKSGSLDSGMGFESLIGAAMMIDTIDIRQIDGKRFVAHDYKQVLFGELSEEQQDFLMEAV